MPVLNAERTNLQLLSISRQRLNSESSVTVFLRQVLALFRQKSAASDYFF
jgi:hypothetical protein